MSDVPALVTNWMKIGRTVISSIRVNAELVAPEIQRVLFPKNPEGTEVRTMYLARADALERQLKAFEKCALALRAQRGNDETLGDELTASVDALRERVMRTRSLIEALFDTAVLSAVGLTGETPEDPDELVTYANHTAQQLRKVSLPALDKDVDVTFNPIHRAELIEAEAARVKAATVAEATDDRVEQQLMQARDAALGEVRHTYISAADGFSADAVAAGYPKIADRVRPTARRREGKPEPIDLEEPEPVNPEVREEPEPVNPEVRDEQEPVTPDPTLVTDPTSET